MRENTSTDTAPAWFAEPGIEHWPATYWFWHREPTVREIETQLAEILAGGFRTVLIQARMAYPLGDYLGDCYLEAYALAARTARKLGLEVGIYDEYNWLSGQAGGRTVAGRDHLRERHVFWSETAGGDTVSVTGIRSPFIEGLGDAGRNWIYEGGVPTWGEWEIVAAVARRGSGDEIELRSVTETARIAEQRPDGCTIAIDALPGWQTTVFVSARSLSSRLINYLLPEAAERFVEVAYDRYRNAVGAYFADVVKYMFFDHPYNAFYVWDELAGDVRNSLLYDRRFAEQTARDLAREPGYVLDALVHDAGPSTDVVRAEFFERYHRQMHQSFFGTLRQWCTRHGVGLAGHELLAHVGGWGLNDGFGRVDSRTAPGLDYFAVDGFRTHTTVDASNYGAQVAAKFGDSVARANGRSRCIVEQYATGRERGAASAAGQWDVTLETTRNQAIRHHLLGARQYLAHAFYQTDGWPNDPSPYSNPRFDFAPGVNFEPWYAFHGDFAQESARLSAFLELQPVHTVGLFYPLETLRARGSSQEASREFGAWARALSEAGCGFDIIDESMFSTGTVEDGMLAMPSGRYRTVILPGAEIFADQRTVDLLEELLCEGGTVLCSGPLPTRQRGSGDGIDIGTRCAAWFHAEAFSEHARQTAAGDRTEVARIAQLQPGPLALASDDLPLWQWAAEDGDGWRFVVFNDAAHRRSLHLRVPTPDLFTIERWQPEDGHITTYDLSKPAGRDSFPVEIDANEPLCLRFVPAAAARQPSPRKDANGAKEADMTLDLASDWTLRFQGGAKDAVAIGIDRGWEEQGFDTVIGTGIYARSVQMTEAMAAMEWELELPEVHTAAAVVVNGNPLGRRGWAPYRFLLPSSAWQAGTNRLEIHVSSTAGNHYYAGTPYLTTPVPCGLRAAPLLRGRKST